LQPDPCTRPDCKKNRDDTARIRKDYLSLGEKGKQLIVSYNKIVESVKRKSERFTTETARYNDAMQAKMDIIQELTKTKEELKQKLSKTTAQHVALGNINKTLSNSLVLQNAKHQRDVDQLGNAMALKDEQHELTVAELKEQLRQASKAHSDVVATLERVKAEKIRLEALQVGAAQPDTEDTAEAISSKLDSKLDVKLDLKFYVQKYQCNKCTESFRSKDGLQSHYNKHTHKLLQCKQCEKSFWSPTAFDQHKKFHISGGFTCTICGKLFQREATLKVHANVHKEATYCCTVAKNCPAKYKYKCDRDEHDQYAHIPSKTLKCPFCDKLFQMPTNVQSHVNYNHPDGFKKK
jgi:SHS2 domain-containing protein